jgi:MFS-type transporter involved in bile tolerance (Atg22 family)
VALFGKSIYGVIGIVIVLVVGLALLIPIKENATRLK